MALETAFAEAAARGLTVGAVLIVSPTYFGSCSDIAGALTSDNHLFSSNGTSPALPGTIL